MASGGSLGARRGAKVESMMDLSKAKKLQNTGSGKPNLDKASNDKKVTNSPKMAGKRMK